MGGRAKLILPCSVRRDVALSSSRTPLPGRRRLQLPPIAGEIKEAKKEKGKPDILPVSGAGDGLEGTPKATAKTSWSSNRNMGHDSRDAGIRRRGFQPACLLHEARSCNLHQGDRSERGAS